MKIRIILADDHEIILEGLVSLLQQQPNLEVVGHAEDGQSALELVRKLNPDIVITDVIMPKINGIETTRQIVHQFPKVKVIALSGHSHEYFVIGMLKAGASAYVLKDCLFDELLEAIQAVKQGESYLSPKVTGTVVSNYVRLSSGSFESPLNSLTEREREVLRLIGEGRSTKQIALELNVSNKTIEVNRRKIMKKLRTHSIVDLVKYAINGGLASLEL